MSERRTKKPPFGQEQIHRICNRRVLPQFDENGDDVICGAEGKFHIIWDIETMENGYACLDHASEATERWQPDAWHPMGDCCGMPGSLYFAQENVCRYEDGLPVAEVERECLIPA